MKNRKRRCGFAIAISFLLLGCSSGVTSIQSTIPSGTKISVFCEKYSSVPEAARFIAANRNQHGWIPMVSGWKDTFSGLEIHICYEKPKESDVMNHSGRPLSPPVVNNAK